MPNKIYRNCNSSVVCTLINIYSAVLKLQSKIWCSFCNKIKWKSICVIQPELIHMNARMITNHILISCISNKMLHLFLQKLRCYIRSFFMTLLKHTENHDTISDLYWQTTTNSYAMYTVLRCVPFVFCLGNLFNN